LQFFAGAVAIAIAVVFVVAVILNAVKDPEELRSPPGRPHLSTHTLRSAFGLEIECGSSVPESTRRYSRTQRPLLKAVISKKKDL
jgi:hypothetical protein